MSIKTRLQKLEVGMKKASNYSQIIRKHAIEHNEGYGKDEAMMVHAVMALYITSSPEHKNVIKARNYLAWINGYNSKVIDGAYSAIKDLIAAGLATFTPTEFISDGRDTSSMIPPYPYLCNAGQILHYSTSKDTQFWISLQ